MSHKKICAQTDITSVFFFFLTKLDFNAAALWKSVLALVILLEAFSLQAVIYFIPWPVSSFILF